MTMSANLHDPVIAEAHLLSTGRSSLCIEDADGNQVVIFTTYAAAKAVADAFNAAMHGEAEPIAAE